MSPVLNAFTQAWSAGDSAGVVALARSHVELVQNFLEQLRDRHGGELPPFGPAQPRLGPTGFRVAHPCGRSWLVASWGRERGGSWELNELGLWR